MRRLLILSLCIGAAGCAKPDERASGSAPSDSAFAAVQARGNTAMGVDQYTSAHVFEPLPDGGRIVLQREVDDAVGVATIRAHMADIARRFASGDFSLPGFVHAQAVPGIAIMAEQRAVIKYVADTLPRGGEVRIRTADAGAIAAIHEFLAFQRQDHRAGAQHSEHGKQ